MLELPLATLTVDVTSVTVQTGTVTTVLALGAPRGTSLAGLVTFSAFVASLADLVFDAEDNISAALAQSVSGTTGYTLGNLLTDSTGALLGAVTTTTDSMNPSLGTTTITDPLVATTQSTVGGLGTTLDGATAPTLGTLATTTGSLLGTLDPTVGGVLAQTNSALTPFLAALEQMLADIEGTEGSLGELLAGLQGAVDREIEYRLDGTYRWLGQLRGNVQEVQDIIAGAQGVIDREIEYRLNGTYRWLRQLRGNIQEVQDIIADLQGTVDAEVQYRLDGTYRWFGQLQGNVREVQDILAALPGAVDDEVEYRLNGTYHWLGQLQGNVQEVQDILAGLQAAADAEAEYRMRGTLHWLTQLQGNVREIQEITAAAAASTQGALTDAQQAMAMAVQGLQDSLDTQIASLIDGTQRWLRQLGGNIQEVQDIVASVEVPPASTTTSAPPTNDGHRDHRAGRHGHRAGRHGHRAGRRDNDHRRREDHHRHQEAVLIQRRAVRSPSQAPSLMPVIKRARSITFASGWRSWARRAGARRRIPGTRPGIHRLLAEDKPPLAWGRHLRRQLPPKTRPCTGDRHRSERPVSAPGED